MFATVKPGDAKRRPETQILRATRLRTFATGSHAKISVRSRFALTQIYFMSNSLLDRELNFKSNSELFSLKHCSHQLIISFLRPIYTRQKKWNGSPKFSSVNRILSIPFVPDPFLKRTATGCGPFQERIG